MVYARSSLSLRTADGGLPCCRSIWALAWFKKCTFQLLKRRMLSYLALRGILNNVENDVHRHLRCLDELLDVAFFERLRKPPH